MQQKVLDFHIASNSVVGETLNTLDANTAILRMTLMREELSELETALEDHDLNGIADGLADLLYVVLGTAVSCGINIEPVFNEVHRSNMTKFIDGYRRADGKWIKGPSYSPADITSVLQQQQLAP